MSNLLEQVRTFCEQPQLFKKNDTIIVGLSGGPDSVALLSLLNELKDESSLTLIAAHLDHQWRKDSGKDVLFCEQLTKKLGIPFVYKKADQITLTKKTKGSQEEEGRLLRRAFFEQLVQTYQAHSIALGHHANDQQETFFLRLIRGASIAGLAAMKPRNGLYIRPLLSTTKQEIISYLDEQKLNFLTDETNNDTKYLRNALRKNVLPALRSSDARFDDSFFKTLSSVQETDAYLERVTQDIFSSLTTEVQGATLLDTYKFLATDPFLQQRVLVTWLCTEQVPFTPSRAFFEEIVRFMGNTAQEHAIHSLWSLAKEGEHLRIIKKEP